MFLTDLVAEGRFAKNCRTMQRANVRSRGATNTDGINAGVFTKKSAIELLARP